MSRWIIFAGITAMLVTGYFAIFFERGEGLLRSVRFVPAKLQLEAETALARAGLRWALVQVNGQRALLSGVAPNEDDREEAVRVVKASSGQGGTWWGGITGVDYAQVSIAEPVKPFKWVALLGADQRVRFTGHVPGYRIKTSLREAAKKLFPNGVEDETVSARGQPTGDWEAAAILSLQQLKRLAAGRVEFVDDRVTLRGQAQDPSAQDSIALALASVKRPFQGVAELNADAAELASTTDVLAAAEPLTVTPLPKPELGAEAEEEEKVEVASVERKPNVDCQVLLDKAMNGKNVVRFERGSAAIPSQGIGGLDVIARLATECRHLNFNVTGHTDKSSEEAAIVGLARKRASAVRAYLVGKGVNGSRLSAVSAGATQPDRSESDPASSQHRRVEIELRAQQ